MKVARRLRPASWRQAGRRGAASATPWIVGAYVLLRLRNFEARAIVAGGDSKAYVAISDFSLLDWDFWTSHFPWATPLLYKVLWSDELRAGGQLLLSTIAWTVLALTVARLMRSGPARVAALVGVLAFSLSIHIVSWDPLLLSESLSLSLFALVVAAWLALVNAPSRRAVAALVALTFVWVFTRDSNAWLGLMALPAVAWWGVRTPRVRLLALAAGAGIVLTFALASVAAREGHRHAFYFRHVLVERLHADKTAEAYMYEHGLPRPAAGQRAYVTWLRDDSTRVYATFLLTHPRYALTRPFDDVSRWLSPRNVEYVHDRYAVLPRAVEELVYPPDTGRLWFWAVLVALAATAVALRLRMRAAWAVPLALIVLALPHGILVWHADAPFVDRHALLIGIHVRLGLLLLLLLAADRVLERRRSAGQRASAGGRRTRADASR